MADKLKETVAGGVASANDYATLLSLQVLPQISEVLINLKEENTHNIKYKIEGAKDADFTNPELLKAETTIAKDGTDYEVIGEPWLYIRVQHKDASAGIHGKTSCTMSGN